MQIILDGKPVPVNIRLSRDLLIALKGISRMLNWELSYDASKEQIIIKSNNFNVQPMFPERVEIQSSEPERYFALIPDMAAVILALPVRQALFKKTIPL